MQDVANDTWDSDKAAGVLAAIQSAIETGVAPRYAPSPIQDGDQNQPEYNAGTFVIKAARRINQGAPPLFGIDGKPIVDASQAPKQGDGVIVAINVWGMKQHDRINFTVEGVRLAQVGIASGGPPPAAIAEALTELSTMALPGSIPGVQPQPGIEAGPAAVPAQPAAAAAPVSAVLPPENGAPEGTQALFRQGTTPAGGVAVEIEHEVDPDEVPEKPSTGPSMFDLS